MIYLFLFSLYLFHRYIHSHNRKPLTYKLAINHLVDRHTDEMRASRGRLVSKGYNGGQPFDTSDIDPSDVPDNLDWRLKGKFLCEIWGILPCGIYLPFLIQPIILCLFLKLNSNDS